MFFVNFEKAIAFAEKYDLELSCYDENNNEN